MLAADEEVVFRKNFFLIFKIKITGIIIIASFIASFIIIIITGIILEAFIGLLLRGTAIF